MKFQRCAYGSIPTVLREHSDIGDASDAFHERTSPLTRERFDFATQLDEQRLPVWTGGDVGVASREANYALFSTIAGGVAAPKDPDIFRAHVRRIGLLDSNAVIDCDESLQQRIEELFESRCRPLGRVQVPRATRCRRSRRRHSRI